MFLRLCLVFLCVSTHQYSAKYARHALQALRFLSLQFLPLQCSLLYILRTWLLLDFQFLTVGALLSLPPLPLHVLKPRNSVKIGIQDNHRAYLICPPPLRIHYPYLPDNHFLAKCHYLSIYPPISGMILSLIWLQAGVTLSWPEVDVLPYQSVTNVILWFSEPF